MGDKLFPVEENLKKWSSWRKASLTRPSAFVDYSYKSTKQFFNNNMDNKLVYVHNVDGLSAKKAQLLLNSLLEIQKNDLNDLPDFLILIEADLRHVILSPKLLEMYAFFSDNANGCRNGVITAVNIARFSNIQPIMFDKEGSQLFYISGARGTDAKGIEMGISALYVPPGKYFAASNIAAAKCINKNDEIKCENIKHFGFGADLNARIVMNVEDRINRIDKIGTPSQPLFEAFNRLNLVMVIDKPNRHGNYLIVAFFPEHVWFRSKVFVDLIGTVEGCHYPFLIEISVKEPVKNTDSSFAQAGPSKAKRVQRIKTAVQIAQETLTAFAKEEKEKEKLAAKRKMNASLEKSKKANVEIINLISSDEDSN